MTNSNPPSYFVPPNLQPDVERFISLYHYLKDFPLGKKNVMILGPTGVGKSLFIKLFEHMYYADHGKKSNVLRLNIAALNENLIESELFGHTKGAFTGASDSRKGFIEQANGGLLIIEEIGDIPKSVQAKLLTFIEDGYYYSVGSETPKRAGVQLIATTNKTEEDFREDFWHRFIPFRIPPLHERRGDILYYLYHRFPEIIKSLHSYEILPLLAYHWPGNVREIEQLGMLMGWAQSLPEKNIKIEAHIDKKTGIRRLVQVDHSKQVGFYKKNNILEGLDNLGIQSSAINFRKIYGLVYSLKVDGVDAAFLNSMLKKYNIELSYPRDPQHTKPIDKLVFEKISEPAHDMEFLGQNEIGYQKPIELFEQVYKGFEIFCKLFMVSINANVNLIDVKDAPSGFWRPLSVNLFKPQQKLLKLEKDLFTFKTGKLLPPNLKSLPDPLDDEEFYECILAVEEDEVKEMDINTDKEHDVLRELYSRRIKKFAGNLTAAADSLGIPLTTFRDILEKEYEDLWEQRNKR